MIYMKNKIIRIIIAILILACVFGTKFYSRLNDKDLINNYYEYINSDYIKDNPIENGTIGWSMVDKYQDEVDEEINKIADNLINSKTNKNVNIIYNNFMDVNERNKLGIKPLQKYINGINNSKNINELINQIYKIEDELKQSILMNPRIGKDFKDSSKYIVYLYPIMFDFNSDATVYSSSDLDSYEAIIQKYLNRILKTYGYEEKEARKIANEILDMKVDIASKSKKTDDYIDAITYYNIIDKNELQNIYTNINVEKYLSMKGINNQTYSIVDIENYKAFNSYLTNENLGLLKNYFICILLENYSDVLSEKYEKLYYDFANEISGETKEYNINEVVRDNIITIFDDIIEEEYSRASFNENDYSFIYNLIQEITGYYKDEINNLDWMSKETKEKALLKLDNLKINIGLTNHKKYSDNFDIKSSNNLFENINIINKYLYYRNLEYLKGDKEDSLAITTYTVNAFYNPQDNSINFPCAAIKFKQSEDYYENLGSMGMVIAHEITHAFDNNGRKFNEKGEYTDWWTQEDSDNFEKLSKRIIEYYNDYTYLGINVDGKKTLGENIADLGALKCISSLAEKHNATNKDYQNMYASYAKWCAYNMVNEYVKLIFTNDSHSPNDVRVNAVLSSTDKFYDAYNIKKNDKMYKAKNERVGIW